VASGEWTTTKIEGSQLDMCNEAEKVCIIKIQMSSSLEKYVRIGDIKIKYERTL
jgi:ribosome-binding protein aMBF1 (putative translation factor)